jgi:DNA (cytosine-5)-methyltransferase 1
MPERKDMEQKEKPASRASVESFVPMPLTFGSLFAGIGGLDLGFERAGMICKWQVEIDQYARRILAKHWPNVRRWDDVRTWTQPDTEYVDVIAGGFPCQDISNAGKQAGIKGERSGLFFELMRVVRQVGPRFIILENVSALLHRGMDSVLSELAESGFDAEWACIPASFVGAPHKRERVFIVAYATGKRFNPLWDEARKPTQAIASQQVRRTWGSDFRRGDSGRLRLCSNSFDERMGDGFPSGVDRSRLRGLGNAVVPQVAEWIGRQLVAAAS